MTAKPRAVRVEDDLWNPAVAKAQEQGDNLSAIIRDALRTYIQDDQKEPNEDRH